jgi:hypothetical protein
VNTGGVLNSENGGKCGLQALLLDHRQNGIIGAHHHRNPFDDDDELALDSPPTMIKSEPPTSPMLGFHGGHHLPVQIFVIFYQIHFVVYSSNHHHHQSAVVHRHQQTVRRYLWTVWAPVMDRQVPVVMLLNWIFIAI